MQLIGSVWRIGLPLVVVACGALLLVLTARARPEASPITRPYGWLLAVMCLPLAGDAVLGAQRPAFERQWKGAAAVLFGLAAAIHLWKRYRWRASQAGPHRFERPSRQTSPLPTSPHRAGDSVDKGAAGQVGDGPGHGPGSV